MVGVLMNFYPQTMKMCLRMDLNGVSEKKEVKTLEVLPVRGVAGVSAVVS